MLYWVLYLKNPFTERNHFLVYGFHPLLLWSYLFIHLVLLSFFSFYKKKKILTVFEPFYGREPYPMFFLIMWFFRWILQLSIKVFFKNFDFVKSNRTLTLISFRAFLRKSRTSFKWKARFSFDFVCLTFRFLYIFDVGY